MKEKNIESADLPILTFLERTKKGDYAQIEKTSLSYVRMEEEPAYIDIHEETYYYGIS